MEREIALYTLDGVKNADISVHQFATADKLGLSFLRFLRAECDDVVVVTGARRGICRGHARDFARQGAQVVVTDYESKTSEKGGAVGGLLTKNTPERGEKVLATTVAAPLEFADAWNEPR